MLQNVCYYVRHCMYKRDSVRNLDLEAVTIRIDGIFLGDVS